MSDSRGAEGVTSIRQGISGVAQSPEYRSFYSVNFRFRITNTEANITFTNLAETGGGPIVMQDEATLITTFVGLKVLSEHLASAVQVIEEELGPIRVPIAVRPADQHRENMRQMLRSVPMAT